MTLLPDAFTWDGITVGGAGSDVYLDEGIEGWGQPPLNMPSTPRQSGGEFGGLWTPQAATYSVSAWLNAPKVTGSYDFSTFMNLRSTMRTRPAPTDEQPIAWSGLMWPTEVCAWVRPTRFEPAVDETSVHDGVPGFDLQWLASDPTVYSYADPAERLWATGDPVSSDEFPVANDGDLVPWARRAWQVRVTAHGSLVGWWMRVDHPDGTWERIAFPSLTIPSGHVLTIDDDLLPRVQGVIKSKAVASTSNFSATPTVAPRWWRLHPGPTGDEANVVTVGCTSGTFSGFVKTRSTW